MKKVDATWALERMAPLLEQIDDGYVCNKKECLQLLVTLRFAIRGAVSFHNQMLDERRYYSRRKKLMENQGVHFLLVDGYIQNAAKKLQLSKKLLSHLGRQTVALFDLWQEAGATLKELCNLCNKPYEQFLRELPESRKYEPFGAIMFVHTLDHRDTGTGWIAWQDDAPFTHAVKEYMLSLTTETPEGKEASRRALFAMFTNLELHTIAEDELGSKMLLDSNGMPLDDE